MTRREKQAELQRLMAEAGELLAWTMRRVQSLRESGAPPAEIAQAEAEARSCEYVRGRLLAAMHALARKKRSGT